MDYLGGRYHRTGVYFGGYQYHKKGLLERNQWATLLKCKNRNGNKCKGAIRCGVKQRDGRSPKICTDQLVGYRAHSDSCEYSETNSDLQETMDRQLSHLNLTRRIRTRADLEAVQSKCGVLDVVSNKSGECPAINHYHRSPFTVADSEKNFSGCSNGQQSVNLNNSRLQQLTDHSSSGDEKQATSKDEFDEFEQNFKQLSGRLTEQLWEQFWQRMPANLTKNPPQALSSQAAALQAPQSKAPPKRTYPEPEMRTFQGARHRADVYDAESQSAYRWPSTSNEDDGLIGLNLKLLDLKYNQDRLNLMMNANLKRSHHL